MRLVRRLIDWWRNRRYDPDLVIRFGEDETQPGFAVRSSREGDPTA